MVLMLLFLLNYYNFKYLVQISHFSLCRFHIFHCANFTYFVMHISYIIYYVHIKKLFNIYFSITLCYDIGGDFMEIIGIICEYNPFHNGHIYHINKIKEMYPDSVLIACISSSFCERGEISILNKWSKTYIALYNNVDLVVELPFVYSSQSADIFSYGALKMLSCLGVNKLIFGSECNNIKVLKDIANIQLNNDEFDKKVKYYLDKGNNYPTSLSNSIKDFNLGLINSPNDLLGISYIKEIIRNNYNIEPICIKRTNSYHSLDVNSDIISASGIRNLIKSNSDISNYVPSFVVSNVYKNIDIFKYLKYKILCSNDLSIYQTVDEGLGFRIKKYIDNSNSLDDLVNFVKTKRYTYNKINRMFIHILTSLTKDEAKLDIDYIRVLGFNDKGKKYLKDIKNNTGIDVYTNYKKIQSELFDIELRVTGIYSLIVGDSSLIKKEFYKPLYFGEK